MPVAFGGEKFFAWIKSCKEKLPKVCLKKFTNNKSIVLSGENVLPWKATFWLAPALLNPSPSANHNLKRLDYFACWGGR